MIFCYDNVVLAAWLPGTVYSVPTKEWVSANVKGGSNSVPQQAAAITYGNECKFN